MRKIPYHPHKVALVGLDLTAMDDHLMKYAAMISKVLPLERIFFVHVAQTLQLPGELLTEYPGLLKPLDESIGSDVQSKVDHYFGSSDLEVSCLIKEGNPIEKILQLSKIKNVDLILMGRKKSLKGSGLVSSKISRKCPCDLLLVPQHNHLKIKKLLVPVDYSMHSALAMNLACHLQEMTDGAVEGLHVYSVPNGYHKIGKTYEEFADIMESHAQRDYKKFLTQHEFPSDIPCRYVLADDGKHPELTYEYAENHGVDLIVLGSRGRTNIAAILMGSTAEKLVYLDSHVPIFIVKEKGENMGFLDALMKV